MTWVAHCDGRTGLGEPTCRAVISCGNRARIPPALGWTIVSVEDGLALLCERCTDVRLRRLMQPPPALADSAPKPEPETGETT